MKLVFRTRCFRIIGRIQCDGLKKTPTKVQMIQIPSPDDSKLNSNYICSSKGKVRRDFFSTK